jgi:5-methylcytosine-specific restriction endonuclease McrA
MPTITKIERPWIKKNPPAKKDPFYMSRPWKELRLSVLAEDPLCYYCKMSGVTRLGNIADHFRPKKLFPELSLTRENIKGCCDYHHYIKTVFERGLGGREAFEANIEGFLQRLKTMNPARR